MTPFWDDRVAAWVAARIPGCERGFGPNKAMGVAHDGQLVAGLVFHNWNPESGVIECSAAADDARWATRSVLKAATSYAFDVAGCQAIVARTAEENTKVRRLWRAMGAAEYVLPRLRGRNAAEVVLCLTDDAWAASRLNGDRHGKTSPARAA